VIGVVACGEPPAAPPFVPPHSSSIATSSDGGTLFVVNPDSDSLSIIDLHARALVAEVLLAGARPAVDASGAFTPAVMPRALAVSPDDTTVFVTGERAGKLFAVDIATQRVRSVAVGSEPIGVTVSADGFFVFVACSQDAKVVVVAASTLTIVNTLDVPATPWTLGQTSDGSLLVGHLSGPGPSLIDPLTSVVTTLAIADIAPRGDARLAHGEARGMYDVAERPGTQELWVAHLLLGTDTAQPELDFETTVFPTLSVLRPDGFRATLSNDALDIPGADGAFGDVVSGPHAIAFTGDGELAFVVDTNSEDLLVVDANRGVQLALVRPLPGHMPEGIALSPDEQLAYIDQRNTGDVAIVRIDRAPADGRAIALEVDGPPIARLELDPMPATQRLGQHLFYSANSDEYPITRNHWVACASCHVEGRSDAVIWKFEQGPRDTPSNAGGMLGTGFLFRTADRNRVQDYWHTINVEQGGTFEPTANAPQLDALADYVNHGIPLPIPPTTDPVLVAHGKAIFERADVGCATCHGGPRFTDSGAGNPTLDLAGTITLHDVGTCAMGVFPDVAHADVDGHPRAACLFDAPSLQGVASSPPYFHDGRAKTIIDALDQTRGKMGDITSLSPFDELALVEYLRSL
jgi:DNA-binding beta-propeller fold protein YncE